MLDKWKVNLDTLTAEHIDGFRIKKNSSGEQDVASTWIFEKGNPNDETLREGILCFDHHYAKSFLKFYLADLSIEELVVIANEYILKNNLGDLISKEQLERYINDQENFPINTLSIIRAAIYFYKKSKKK